jgi:aspartate kinase/aspartokinase/homoserine dehydrogenase 1
MALHNVNIKFVITSQTSIDLIISKNDLEKVLKIADSLRIKGIEKVRFKTDKAFIAVVGKGLLDNHGIAARIFNSVARSGINVEMISAGASDVSLYFIVDGKEGKEALALVHREFFGTDKNNNIYGGASSDENY